MIPVEDLEVQMPLIHVIESDDLYLQNQADVLWFDVLRSLDWRSLVELAVRYYEALYQFNEDQAEERRRNAETSQDSVPTESQKEANERLLFERATLCKDVPILHQRKPVAEPTKQVDPRTLRPGQPPVRLAGKAPKCFFAMLKAFLGVTLRGKAPEPEVVHEELTSNPSFARTCGFTLPHARLGYRQSDVPSLRKLEQFDQIMTQRGLWSEAAVDQVARNLRESRVQSESTLVHDTTHYPAFSAMQVVELPESNKETASRKKSSKKPTKKKRKSHPKTTKLCRCKQRQTCRHPWVSADEGAGTVAKSTGLYWAHKASTLAFPGDEILLDAVAMSDAASHDSQSLKPHLQRLFQRHPDLKRTVIRILDDGAADDTDLKTDLRSQWGIELLAPINPRRRKPIRDDLPRGIDHVTATGTPVCQEGYPFELIGTRHDTERFLFRAPEDENGTPVCRGCSKRGGCYRGESGSRQVTIAFERLPWLDPNFPQLSKRFRKAMAKRTSIERLHKLMKYDYGDERLTKRGNAAFQARLDKTLLVMHLVLAHD
jgi:hypothetical protein